MVVIQLFTQHYLAAKGKALLEHDFLPFDANYFL